MAGKPIIEFSLYSIYLCRLVNTSIHGCRSGPRAAYAMRCIVCYDTWTIVGAQLDMSYSTAAEESALRRPHSHTRHINQYVIHSRWNHLQCLCACRSLRMYISFMAHGPYNYYRLTSRQIRLCDASIIANAQTNRHYYSRNTFLYIKSDCPLPDSEKKKKMPLLFRTVSYAGRSATSLPCVRCMCMRGFVATACQLARHTRPLFAHPQSLTFGGGGHSMLSLLVAVVVVVVTVVMRVLHKKGSTTQRTAHINSFTMLNASCRIESIIIIRYTVVRRYVIIVYIRICT